MVHFNESWMDIRNKNWADIVLSYFECRWASFETKATKIEVSLSYYKKAFSS